MNLNAVTFLVVGAIITAPVVVPVSMACGVLVAPLLSIKALWHKASMEYHKNKSGLKFNGKTIDENTTQILAIKDLGKLKQAKKQIDQIVKLNQALRQTKSAALCVLPFGVYSVFINGLKKNPTYKMPTIKKVISDEIKNYGG